MHKVLILGAGKIGALISGLLAESGEYDVTLGDVDAAAAEAVVKAHGELHWSVTYRLPDATPVQEGSAKYEHALFSFADRPSVGGWWRMCAGDEK